MIAARLQAFRVWWHKPATPKDRFLGAMVGGFGCFWIGVLGRLLIGPMPVTFSTLVAWAVGSLFVGVVLGVLFPKSVSVVCFPFATFGGGVGS